MRTDKFRSAFLVLERWTDKLAPLSAVADAFGMRYEVLFDLFFTNDLCNSNGTPEDYVGHQLCANCLLLYVAQRLGM